MASDNPVVSVKQGQLRGVVVENVYGGQFLAFRGIPYAKPPVGPLRFKDPEPPEPWTGTRDASVFGDVCAQIDIRTWELIGSDDCLYLNVYSPLNDSPKRAVMLWIHGGAFMNDSGNDKFYGPDYLVRKDVVLVTINYRVGVLGFLTLEHEIAPGNQGIKDQVMALKWIQENISNFGGDPNNVTIFGESAGAALVHYLTLSPLAEGLFHKAISQSGVAANPWAITSKEPRKYAFQLAAQLGEHSTDPATVLEFLRKVEPQKLVTTAIQIVTPEMRYTKLGLFDPCIDDKSPNPIIPQHPSVLIQSGVKVPFLLGFNKNEGAALHICKSEKNFQQINEKFEIIIHPELMLSMKKDGITPNDLKRIYFNNEPISSKLLQQYADFITDSSFRQGIYEVLKIQLEKSVQPTYFYQFTYDNKNSFVKRALNIPLQGPTHGDDLTYIFQMTKGVQLRPLQPGTDNYRVMEYFTQMWTDFAKTGNPTPKVTGLITTVWKPLEKGNVYNYLNISNRLRMETISKDDQRFNWKRINNKYY
ncbi:juvenile hormone esterase-like [Osmia bicornis bicornis]|uniref:juvenile hormone esterase-like n=1 Tax=Osmia bicornis bicornis TaxID=1437191 RepID=UPI0010F7E974|nr:juvenile hormone esterase-like [Osmia bicornis bicornis]